MIYMFCEIYNYDSYIHYILTFNNYFNAMTNKYKEISILKKVFYNIYKILYYINLYKINLSNYEILY